ncbi:MAG: competence/damage-inducible protein A [Anaerolineae bacterium]|nr:MAG: competence/damage-inducible protein A [Anaerolineae bacterium]
MPSAEIITIGTEILLGEIVDTNSAWLARKLRDLNIDVFRTSTVGDNVSRIAEIIRETLKRADIIITTGGLGPTIDDPTREAVALAFDVQTVYLPELWDQIVERMQRFGRTPTENQKRQAFVPQGALPIKNAVGTAPAFIMETGTKCLIALPGVPREMEYLAENEIFPYLRKRYDLRGVIKARVLHTAGMGESVIDEHIGEFEKLSNPTVGLAAHYGVVDIRITAKALSEEEADRQIAKIESAIRQKLGHVIYGTDDETLEAVVLDTLASLGYTLTVIEAGTGGELARRLAGANRPVFLGGQILPALVEKQALAQALAAQKQATGASIGLGIAVMTATGASQAEFALITPAATITETRGYGGHPKNAAAWAVNSALDWLRNAVKT